MVYYDKLNELSKYKDYTNINKSVWPILMSGQFMSKSSRDFFSKPLSYETKVLSCSQNFNELPQSLLTDIRHYKSAIRLGISLKLNLRSVFLLALCE